MTPDELKEEEERRAKFRTAPKRWVRGLFRRTRVFFMELESRDAYYGCVAQIKHKSRYRVVACRVYKKTWEMSFGRVGVKYEFLFSCYHWHVRFSRWKGLERISYMGLFQLIEVCSAVAEWCEADIEESGYILSGTTAQFLREMPRYEKLRNFRIAKAKENFKQIGTEAERRRPGEVYGTAEIIINEQGELVEDIKEGKIK